MQLLAHIVRESQNLYNDFEENFVIECQEFLRNNPCFSKIEFDLGNEYMTELATNHKFNKKGVNYSYIVSDIDEYNSFGEWKQSKIDGIGFTEEELSFITEKNFNNANNYLKYLRKNFHIIKQGLNFCNDNERRWFEITIKYGLNWD